MRRILPVPWWIVILVFIVGISLGVGIGFGLPIFQQMQAETEQEKSKEKSARKRAHKDEKSNEKRLAQAKKKEETADGKKSAKGESKGDEKASTQAKPAKKQMVIPPPNDKHWLSNMSNSPLKRALVYAIGKLKPDVADCYKEASSLYPDNPNALTIRFEFENIGKMATVTDILIYGKTDGDKYLAACLRKRVMQKMIAFPVDDGTYSAIHSFKSSKKAED